MVARAALLPAGSDPFLIAYWLRNYATWAQSVDELHIWVNGPLEMEAKEYIGDLLPANASLEYTPSRSDHGTVLRNLLHKTKADTIMFCEDDAFVRRPGIVDECFRFAEDGGIVATPRPGYASAEVIGAATAKLGGDHSYWPCFVFVSRKALLATDQDFSGTLWSVGDRLFDHTMAQDGGSDTMVWASYQLRAMGLEEKLIDNHRLSGQTVPDDAPWFHVGSLSSGHGLMWMGELTDEQYQFERAGFMALPAGNAWQRLAWWTRAWQCAEGAIPDYWRRYGEGLTAFRDDLHYSAEDIAQYWNTIPGLVTWAER